MDWKKWIEENRELLYGAVCDAITLNEEQMDAEDKESEAEYEDVLAELGKLKDALSADYRLASIRRSIEDENVSYGELAELQALAEFIDPSDTVLLEWAGIPEFPES